MFSLGENHHGHATTPGFSIPASLSSTVASNNNNILAFLHSHQAAISATAMLQNFVAVANALPLSQSIGSRAMIGSSTAGAPDLMSSADEVRTLGIQRQDESTGQQIRLPSESPDSSSPTPVDISTSRRTSSEMNNNSHEDAVAKMDTTEIRGDVNIIGGTTNSDDQDQGNNIW